MKFFATKSVNRSLSEINMNNKTDQLYEQNLGSNKDSDVTRQLVEQWTVYRNDSLATNF